MTCCDTHCHLDFPEFDRDRDAVIAAAARCGVALMVNVGTSAASSRASVELARRHPGVLASAGIHPSEASAGMAAFGEIEALAADPLVRAIGETGLDYHYEGPARSFQMDLFRAHIALAAATGLPLIVHQRESRDDVIAILDRERAPSRVVFHCFGGDPVLAAYCRERGFWISFTGILTFANARAVRDAAASYPIERIMVETDAPYLAPVPHRGKRNEPSRVVHVVRELARVRGMPEDECARTLAGNAAVFFAPPPGRPAAATHRESA